MKRKIVYYILTIIVLALVSCKSPSSKQSTNDTVADDKEQAMEGFDQEEATDGVVEEDYAITPQKEEPQPAEKAESKTAKGKTAAPSIGGKETLYISTYGANGKVWGHVTMNGNKGRGTIHDDEENSYSITVTRHGGELHGIDQNGREYVFRM